MQMERHRNHTEHRVMTVCIDIKAIHHLAIQVTIEMIKTGSAAEHKNSMTVLVITTAPRKWNT